MKGRLFVRCGKCPASLLCHSPIEILKFWCLKCEGWWLVKAGMLIKCNNFLRAHVPDYSDISDYLSKVTIYHVKSKERTTETFQGVYFLRVLKECPACKENCRFKVTLIKP